MSFELQNTLSTVIQQLASFFGMTTETIMENAPMWLAKYGWYTLMQNLPMVIFLWVAVIGCIFAIIIWAGYYGDWKTKSIVILCVLTVLVFSPLIFGAWYAQCAISPEMYGLNALLTLIKSK